MADDSFYMKQALAEAARAAERGEVPVGAVVVCRDRILARAHNLTETLHDVTAHAEMQATYCRCQFVRSKIFDRLYALRYGRALCDVCRCHCLVAGRSARFRCRRREKRLPALCTSSLASEDRGRERGAGR